MSVKLTNRMDGFAQAIAGGKNQSDAYRENYSTKTMAEKTIWARASELAKNSKVTVRISQIKSELAAVCLWTREQSVIALSRIAETSERDSDRIAAVKELNIMHGFNEPGKLELLGPDGVPLEIKSVPTLTEQYAAMRLAKSGSKK